MADARFGHDNKPSDSKAAAVVIDENAEAERLDDIRNRQMPSFYCPITMQVFAEPVITPGGHTYEYTPEFKAWVEAKHTDPKSREEFDLEDLRTNFAVKNLISEYNENVLMPFDKLQQENEKLKKELAVLQQKNSETKPSDFQHMAKFFEAISKEVSDLKQSLQEKTLLIQTQNAKLAEQDKKLAAAKKYFEICMESAQEFLGAKPAVSLDLREPIRVEGQGPAPLLDFKFNFAVDDKKNQTEKDRAIELDRMFAHSLVEAEKAEHAKQAGSRNVASQAFFIPADNRFNQALSAMQQPSSASGAAAAVAMVNPDYKEGAAKRLSDLNYNFLRAVDSMHYSEVARFLADGAWIDCANASGHTALHFAAKNNDLKMTAFLIQNGANKKLMNTRNQTAWQLLIQLHGEHANRNIYNLLNIPQAYNLPV